MKRWISLFYSAIATGAVTEVLMLMPADGVVVGIQLSVLDTSATTTFTTVWVAQAVLQAGYVNLAPILAVLNHSNNVATALGSAVDSSGLYVPQKLPVRRGQSLVLSVNSIGSSTTGFCIIQLEV